MLVTHTGQTCTNTAGLAVSPLHGHGTMQQRPCTGRSPDLVLSPPRPHDRVASQGLERNVSPADWPATSIARCRQPPRHQLLRRQARSSLRPPFLLGTRPRAGSFCHASPSASRRGWGALHRTRSHLAYPPGLPAYPYLPTPGAQWRVTGSRQLPARSPAEKGYPPAAS